MTNRFLLPVRWLPRWTAAVAVTVALAGAAAACGLVDPDDEDSEAVEAAWERWQQARPASYVYAVELLCFCGDRGPVRVSVDASGGVERVYVDGGEEVPEDRAAWFPTVDGLFETIRDAIDRDAHAIDVEYDPVTGVPTEVFIDYQVNVADEEQGFRVTEPVTAR